MSTYNARRIAQALPRWRMIAERRDRGDKFKDIAVDLGMNVGSVHKLEQKFRSWQCNARLAGLKQKACA